MRRPFRYLIAPLTLALLLAACAKAEKYPGLSDLNELAVKLAETYNEVAQKAIDNGWEYDDETVTELDKIARVIETINAGIEDPTLFGEGQIEVLTESAKEFIETLNGPLRSKVSAACGLAPQNKGEDE